MGDKRSDELTLMEDFVVTPNGPQQEPSGAGGVYSGVCTLIRCAMLVLPLSVISCGPGVDLTEALRVELVATGWHETSASPGHIKLVPAATFQLKNVSNQPLTYAAGERDLQKGHGGHRMG